MANLCSAWKDLNNFSWIIKFCLFTLNIKQVVMEKTVSKLMLLAPTCVLSVQKLQELAGIYTQHTIAPFPRGFHCTFVAVKIEGQQRRT